MIHQPSCSGFRRHATDIDIHAKDILRMRELVNQLAVKHTGQNFAKIAKDADRDFIMDAQPHKEYGIIDEIILKHK